MFPLFIDIRVRRIKEVRQGTADKHATTKKGNIHEQIVDGTTMELNLINSQRYVIIINRDFLIILEYYSGFTLQRIIHITRHNVPYALAQWTPPVGYSVTNTAL